MARLRRELRESPGLGQGVDELTWRRRALQRVLLESVALDSPLYERHQALLDKAGRDKAAQVEAYEKTIREAGRWERYEQLMQRAPYRVGGSQ